jgi:acetoin utilization deacetylase AcuC-like enzyme
MTTAYITDSSYTQHTLAQHPEHSGRIESVWEQLDRAGLSQRLSRLYPKAVTDEQILRVHTQAHLDRLKWTAQQDSVVLIDQDTYALPSSLHVARLTAGGVVQAIDQVMSGKADNALAAVRPPGHHATPDRQMGFCLINNVAVGARHAQHTYNAEKILILDYDVHHGNGTQDIFYDDDSVMFISIHQSPFYPGSGRIGETGNLQGHQYTLNVPIAGGYGDSAYRLIFDDIVWRAVEQFAPDLMLISVGFDAHWVDPLAQMRLSLAGYDYLARECIKMANAVCNGKIVFVMEGGYDLKALGHGWRNIAHALLDEDELSDPYGAAPYETPANNLKSDIHQIRLLHGL